MQYAPEVSRPPSGLSPAASSELLDIRATPVWAALRSQLDQVVESILAQIFETTSRRAAEALATVDRQSLAAIERLEGRQHELEEEIATRSMELHEVRARIEGERVKSSYRARLVQELDDLRGQIRADQAASGDTDEIARRALGEQRAAELLAEAQRQADALVTEARARADDIKRSAELERQRVFAQARELEHRLRRLDGPVDPALGQPLPDVPIPAEQAPLFTIPGYIAAAPLAVYDRPTLIFDWQPPAPRSRPRTGFAGAGSAPRVTDTEQQDDLEAAADSGVADGRAPASPTPTPTEPPPAAPSVDGQPTAVTSARAVEPETVSSSIVFHDVRTFQTARAIERSLTAMSKLSDVRVTDFDERRLAVSLRHPRGLSLLDTVLARQPVALELVNAEDGMLDLRVSA